MRAGALDRRVTVYKRTVGTNAQHEPIETFTSDGEVWGEVVDLRGRDFFAARAVNNEVTTRFRIRWRTDMTTKDRLGYGDRLFDIVQLSEIGRQFGLEILSGGQGELMSLQIIGGWLKADSGVTALVAQRIYAVQFPEAGVFPCIGMQRLSTDAFNHLSGHAALDENTVLVDVYARTYTSAVAVRDAVKTCLYANGIVCQTESEDYDSAVQLYRITSQWLIFT